MDYIKWSREGWSGDERLAFMCVFGKRKKAKGGFVPPTRPLLKAYMYKSLCI